MTTSLTPGKPIPAMRISVATTALFPLGLPHPEVAVWPVQGVVHPQLLTSDAGGDQAASRGRSRSENHP